jgi:hypothetical protein
MIAPARIYAMEQANKLVKISLAEFFKHVQSQFYPAQDISFMDYFLELTHFEDKFVVPHTKLIEYGVMTSTKSAKVLEKLTNLGLENDVHYRVSDVRLPVKQGGFTKSKQYTLTPEAFKICLMRAQRRTDQGKDPVTYAMYYLLLEKVFKLYTDYEREYSKCILAIKDNKIDELKADMKKILARTDHIIVQNDDHKYELRQLHIKFDAMFEYCYGTSSRKCVIRPDLDDANLSANDYALHKIKLLTAEYSSQDHVEYMKENGLLSKEDLPALRAIAKCEKIDVSELDDQYKDELEEVDL